MMRSSRWVLPLLAGCVLVGCDKKVNVMFENRTPEPLTVVLEGPGKGAETLGTLAPRGGLAVANIRIDKKALPAVYTWQAGGYSGKIGVDRHTPKKLWVSIPGGLRALPKDIAEVPLGVGYLARTWPDEVALYPTRAELAAVYVRGPGPAGPFVLAGFPSCYAAPRSLFCNTYICPPCPPKRYTRIRQALPAGPAAPPAGNARPPASKPARQPH